MHKRLVCTLCKLQYDRAELLNECQECGKPLYAQYGLSELTNKFTPEKVLNRATRTMWSFSEVLPVDSAQDAVSLGEGFTPLIKTRPHGPFEKWENLWIKDESLNPTASFKARGMAAAVSRARELGVRWIALPSAGNAAGAASAYCAQAGIRCSIFVPKDTPPANIIECVEQGADIYLVDGLISDAGKLVKAGRERFGWFDVSTLKEPFRVEGKKIMGYELALDMQGATRTDGPCLPDVVIYPAGGGTGLVGMWKAFDEMEQLGWIGSERPRMVAVQATGCAPIVRAFESGERFATPFTDAHTIASGLRVPAAIGDFLMLDAIRASSGTALAINDEELMIGQRELATHQGVFAAPEGGAVWKAAETLRTNGWIKDGEKVVLFNTGSGLKYLHLNEIPDLPVIDPRSDQWHSVVKD